MKITTISALLSGACLVLVSCSSASKYAESTDADAAAAGDTVPALRIQPAAGAAATETTPTLTLGIGDPAPGFDIEHWVKGDEVAGFEPGGVYVVEFWATWCGPCRSSMPHISAMQDEYAADVTFIGISDESREKVASFLEGNHPDGSSWDSQIRYTLTCDPDRSVHDSYMKAAGQRGIPTAFIVGPDAHIEWIGHPMGMDDTLAAVVDGNWDRVAYQAEFAREREAEAAFMKARTRMMTAQRDGDWDTLTSIYDELLAMTPDNTGLQMRKFNALIMKGDIENAYAYADTIAKANWDNSSILNAMSWTVADEFTPEAQDLAWALPVAMRASELTEHADAAILDTVARIHYEQGDIAEAITWQQKSAKHAEEGTMGESIRETLATYEAEAEKAYAIGEAD